MSKYITKSGQNLFDVSLKIFGSIEGVFDLLLSNPGISYETIFNKGIELDYHENFIINQDIVNWLANNKITVKNGYSEIVNVDVKEEIKAWIRNTNKQSFSTKKLISVSDNAVIKPRLSASSGGLSGILSPTGNAVNNLVTSFQWGNQAIKKADKATIDTIKDKFKIDLSTATTAEQGKYADFLYSMGIIILPTDPDELSAYYDMLAEPKIKIKQTGKQSSISVQIPANNLAIIDWGDGSPLEFYHYQAATIKAIHTYSDSDRHFILLYGNNEYTNLDLSSVNGIYYALTNISVNNQFITLFPKENELNKLFIITKNEQKS